MMMTCKKIYYNAFLLLAATERGYWIAKVSTGVFILLACATVASWWAETSAPTHPASSSNDHLTPAPKAHFPDMQPPTSLLKVPITTAALKLTGLIQTAHHAKAIVMVNQALGQVYEEGDSVIEGIKIAAIRSEGVLLDNRGHWECLLWEKP